MAMNNIMLDLECLDSNAQTAAIVSVGAVYFDLEKYKLGEEFYVELPLRSLQDQLNKGRTLSLDTLQWWMYQSDEARSVFYTTNGHPKRETETMLHEFVTFCRKIEGPTAKPKVWGNGVDYDNICLRELYRLYNIGCPWNYSDNRCYRTIKNMHGNAAALVRNGTHHNALDDAKTQAIHLMAMLEVVHNKKKI